MHAFDGAIWRRHSYRQPGISNRLASRFPISVVASPLSRSLTSSATRPTVRATCTGGASVTAGHKAELRALHISHSKARKAHTSLGRWSETTSGLPGVLRCLQARVARHQTLKQHPLRLHKKNDFPLMEPTKRVGRPPSLRGESSGRPGGFRGRPRSSGTFCNTWGTYSTSARFASKRNFDCMKPRTPT